MSEAVMLAQRYSVPALQRAIAQIEQAGKKRTPEGERYLADLREAVRLRLEGVITVEPTDRR